jgi:hypothetical protein
MISSDLRSRIRRLFFAEHWKIGTIAAELGLHRDTVEHAIEPKRFVNSAYRDMASILDPYKDFVRATLESHPRLRATRVLEMIAQRGYCGSVWPLRRYVRRVRPVSRHEAFFRLTTLPGEQAQVDWASFGSITLGSTRRALSCFVMVLSYSRALFARFVLDQTLESFLRCHVAAFDAFHGVPRALLYGRVEGRRGGVQEGLSISAPFGWRCLTSLSITPFPAPAASNRTGGFPASGSPRGRHPSGLWVRLAGARFRIGVLDSVTVK